jgi:hypothetical protein
MYWPGGIPVDPYPRDETPCPGPSDPTPTVPLHRIDPSLAKSFAMRDLILAKLDHLHL